MVVKPGQYWDKTWSIVTGCTPDFDCWERCWARRMARRFGDTEFRPTCHPERLEQPLHWRRPRTVFAALTGDLFNEQIPDGFIAQAFAVMTLTPHITYLVPTKRAARMQELLSGDSFEGDVHYERDQLIDNRLVPWPLWKRLGLKRWSQRDEHDVGVMVETFHGYDPEPTWPLPNLIPMVSISTQDDADERLPFLLQTPAAVRWVSVEPMLGPITILREWRGLGHAHAGQADDLTICTCGRTRSAHSRIDWIVVGGETGPGARPLHPDWVRGLRDQCQAAGVSFYFKRWGEWVPNAHEYGCHNPAIDYNREHVMLGDVAMVRAGKRAAGRLLDGVEWNGFPEARP